jgi:hypothetical protein
VAPVRAKHRGSGRGKKYGKWVLSNRLVSPSKRQASVSALREGRRFYSGLSRDGDSDFHAFPSSCSHEMRIDSTTLQLLHGFPQRKSNLKPQPPNSSLLPRRIFSAHAAFPIPTQASHLTNIPSLHNFEKRAELARPHHGSFQLSPFPRRNEPLSFLVTSAFHNPYL